MKKSICIAIAVIGILVMTVGVNAWAAEPLKLKIGTEGTYPPFNFKDNAGVLQGFDVDIANEICRRIGAECTFILQEWDGMLPGLLAGKFDLIVASMSITEERQKRIDFSIPYRGSTGRFVVRKGSNIAPFKANGELDPDALKGKVLGVERATTYDRYIEAKFPSLERITRYSGVNNMLLDLTSGRVDIIIGGPIKLYQNFLQKPEGKDFEFVGPELTANEFFGTGIGVGLRKGNAELLAKINKALEDIIADGTFKKINQKYWEFSALPGAWKSE